MDESYHEKLLPMTEAQRGVWVAQQIDPFSPRYNCGGYLEIVGELDVGAFTHAVRLALEESETLRVRFVIDEAGPCQFVGPSPSDVVECVDLSAHRDAQRAAVSVMTEDLATPRDLLKDALVQHVLFILPGARHCFFLRYHHILMDGYGQVLYWRRIGEIYTALASGTEPPVRTSYPLEDVVAADASYFASDALSDDRRAWLEYMDDLPAPLNLGGREVGALRGRLRRSVVLPDHIADKLHACAKHTRTRWSVLMLAATAVYVRTLSASDDIVLSLPVPARVGPTLIGTPAMLTNELPLRVRVDVGRSFDALIAEVTRSIGFVLGHQRYRGEALRRDLALAGAGERLGAPVVNIITFDRPVSFGSCDATPHHLSSGPVDDLLIGCYGRMDGVNVDVVFDANPERHVPEDVARHQERFIHLLDALLSADTALPLSAIDTLPASERAHLAAWNQTTRPYDLTRCLHELVDEQACRTPDAIAAAFGTERLSYRMLVEQAERLAAHLVASGVAPGDRVALLEVRSLEMLVSLLAILKTGASYLPIDTEQPGERIAFQLDDASVRVVLTRSTLQQVLNRASAATVICVDTALPGLPAPLAPLPKVSPETAAYVIYTSGSTGRPKGVAVPHRGIVNRLRWMQDQYRLEADDSILQKTPYTFDVSVWEFFWPLLAGCRLVFAEPGAHRDPRRTAALIDEHRITTIHFVPPMLDLFLEEIKPGEAASLRRVICSGEALRPETVAAFFQAFATERGTELHNLYGPTEASIDVTHWRCNPADANAAVPIGRPVANTQIHILDARRKPVPIGVCGELFIGGVQVALGYLNRPELNAKSFLTDPFSDDGRLYRTGDLARWRADGAIEYLGRIDQQIKIRGFRIEPGEIESALLAHPEIRQAIVGAWQVRNGERRLVAYVATLDGSEISHQALSEFLVSRLPEYMIPQHVVCLRELPLSRNGKVDRAMLPMPASDAPAPPDAAPLETPQEKLLAEIWCELLGVRSVGAEQTFFALGGDSMLAIRMRSQTECAGFTFDVQDLFQFPTLRLLARRLRAHAAVDVPAKLAPFALVSDKDRAKIPSEIVDAYPVSAMQGGMLFHAELDTDSSVYRVVTSLRISARFDDALLRRAIGETVGRHPLLRTGFDLSNYSEPLQLVHASAIAPVEVVDAACQTDAEFAACVAAWVDEAKRYKFDVSRPPLMTFAIHLRDAGSFQLSVIEHHAILDGWSDAAMLQEIVDRYAAALDSQDLWLPALPSSYADFVAEELRTVASTAARDYWRNVLAKAEQVDLPRRSTPHIGSSGSHHYAFPVPVAADALTKLQRVAQAQSLPLKSLVAAVHITVLRLVSNADRVTSGLVVNGRLEHESGEAVLGVFLNTLPLSIDTTGLDFVSTAKAAFNFERESSPHRRYPFTEIQRLAGSLELDSYVNFIDFHALWQQRGANGALIRAAIGVAETNYPLAANFLIDPIDGRLRAWLDCDVAQLDESFCERLAGYYARAVETLTMKPNTLVVDVDLIGPEEAALVASWNNTRIDYDRNETIHGVFERRSKASPDAVALVHRNEEVSYCELDARANRLARHLMAEGVTPGGLVGVSLYRGIDMVVAMLAVLKAGCAYVPLDPDYPQERLRFIAEDATLASLIAESTSPLAAVVPRAVLLDRDAQRVAARNDAPVDCRVGGDEAAYVIYTSGSTGLPKGTRIRHRNVTNFFAGMDERIGCGSDDVVLAVTSMSFDISVLELLWPLTRGSRVVIAGEKIVQNLVEDKSAPVHALGLSLFFFAAAAGKEQLGDGYRLVLEAAKMADALGFEAIWTPERHFHEFGGLYPNPSVLSAALATVTHRIRLRSGSVVAPLHDTIRIAEEWSLVDNLSNGRVDLAFASGWNANDFVLAPNTYADRKRRMGEQIEEFLRLWRGEAVERVNGNGERVMLHIFPKPVQAQPPIWLTSAGAIETFDRAGRSGANLLTHLLGQGIDELAKKIAAYRVARDRAGHVAPGRVTIMVHTYLDDDANHARAAARAPFREYLRTSTELWRLLFSSMGMDLPETISEEDLESVLDLAVDRYFDRSGLFGSPESVSPTLQALGAAGADEIACLVDFGVPTDDALKGVTTLGRLKRLHETEVADTRHSFAALCERHGVTLVQGTPSLMAAICAEPVALAALGRVRAVLVGGEAFPAGIADRLIASLPHARIFNMYGPTETTIWSTVHELERAPERRGHIVAIGRPIANTDILIVDKQLRPVPIDVAGELLIGGDGIAGLYLGRPELTEERFPAHPRGTGRIYRTGDRARWRPDGLLEFLGRVDRQVKILGHRIEPDEVESVLSRHAQVANVAVVSREAVPGRLELVAYVAPAALSVDLHAEGAHVSRWAQIWENAYVDSDQEAADTDGHEFAGWKSSYTSDSIAVTQMRDWLSHTVVSVLRLAPRALIDVGVGVGLMLRNVVTAVDRYIGIDVSGTALMAAKASLAHVPHEGTHVDLRQGDAMALASIEVGTADVVVVNSVIQYFPGTAYLERVITEATRIVGKRGAVFIGDVRDLRLIEAFHASVQLERVAPLTTAGELRAIVARKVAEETELCLAPQYFETLAGAIDSVGYVRAEIKRGHAVNELTAFRYDLTLFGGSRADVGAPSSAISWPTLGDAANAGTDDRLLTLESRLERIDSVGLTVTAIPNRRLVKPLAQLRLLNESPAELTAWDIERQVWMVDNAHAVDPEDVATLAERLGLEVQLLVSADGRLDTFDARFSVPLDQAARAGTTSATLAFEFTEQAS